MLTRSQRRDLGPSLEKGVPFGRRVRPQRPNLAPIRQRLFAGTSSPSSPSTCSTSGPLQMSLKPILAISATMRLMVAPAFSAALPTSSSTLIP